MSDPVYADDQTIRWLRELATKGGRGVVNNIDARCLGRIADALFSLRARVAELEAKRDEWKQCAEVEAGVRREFKQMAETAEARVAELEAKLAVAEANLEIARANAASNDLAQETLRFRIAELVALLIQVAHCGGDCPAELLAKIERATPEAGWTDNAGGAHGGER